MAQTRSKSYIHLVGEPLAQFGTRVLPTVCDVLRVYFHRHKKEKMSQKEAVKTVVQELCGIWAKARVPTSEERNIVRKLQALLDSYRDLCRNKKRSGDAQLARETAFGESIKLLFDVAHHDAMTIMTIEEDRQFLLDQRTERKYVMGGVDTKLTKIEENRRKKHGKEMQRKDKEEDRKRKATEMATAVDNSSDTDHLVSSESEDSDTDEYVIPESVQQPKHSTKRCKNASEIISPAIAAALDRTNVSDRKAAYLLTAAAKTYGDGDASVLPLSTSSIRRSRRQHRAIHAATAKDKFLYDGPLVLHFDGKLLAAIAGGSFKED